MISRTSTRPLRLPLALRATTLLLAGLVSAGCSVAGTDLQPGLAARVGGDAITNDRVDELTVAACAVFGDQLEQQNQVLPLGYLSASLVQNLALGSAARQMALQYDVTPGVPYEREVDDTRVNAGDLPDDQLAALTVVRTTNVLLSDLLGQVGARIAEQTALDEGADPDVRGATPGEASDEAISIGQTALTTWLGDHEVDIDPRYGIELSADGVARADTDLSFGVSDAAVAGAAEEPDQAATMRLPSTQRCGSFSGDPVG